jgi:quercetin dioxygenase-like cupin family protein
VSIERSAIWPAGRDVVRSSEIEWSQGDPCEPGSSARVATYLSSANGAAHLMVALVELPSGGTIAGHLHAFEESFYLLEGEVLVQGGDQAHHLVVDDYGLFPIGQGHAWSNPFPATARWLRVHSPHPRPLGGTTGTYAAPTLTPGEGAPVDGLNPATPFVGHFTSESMPAPGQISMPGYHGGNIRSVRIGMMVDELLGARHHTLFVVEFAPTSGTALSAREHFHPFEEIYYFVRGAATGSFDGDRFEIAAGDLVFMGVGASHGFVNTGDEPVRWIEAQSPIPPASNGFFFHDDWQKLDTSGQEGARA